MTYRELLYKATRLADKSEITLGEYEEMTKPLDREVEQEPILDKIDEIITDALDKSTDQKESQTLRWVLDKISEVM